MKTILIFILLATLLAGCEAPPPSSKTVTDDNVVVVEGSALTGIYRITDDKAGVVCWVYAGYEKGGIDCMPISDTKLKVSP